jgi:hypothetical protein
MVEDNLFTILSSEITCAPKALQLFENVDFLALNIREGSPVSLCDSPLFIGNNLAIDLKDAQLWRCPNVIPNYNVSDAVEGIESADRLFLEHTDKRGASGWYRVQLGGSVQNSNDIIDAELHIRIGDFVRGWLRGDIAPARRLEGVGYGLTPSGDDFLCGFYFAVSNLLHENMQVMDLRKEMLSLSVQMTDISRQMVDTYFNGEGNEFFYKFLNAVLQNDVCNLPDIYKEILAFGSTSGTDVAVGILTGLRIVCQLMN